MPAPGGEGRRKILQHNEIRESLQNRELKDTIINTISDPLTNELQTLKNYAANDVGVKYVTNIDGTRLRGKIGLHRMGIGRLVADVYLGTSCPRSIVIGTN